MAFSHADKIAALGSAVTSLTATLPLAVAAGDLLAANIRTADATLTGAKCHDNINGNWTVAGTNTFASLAYFLSSGAAGTNGLTLTVTSASGVIRIAMDRFTGGQFTAVASTSLVNASGTSGNCGTLAAQGANLLLYGGGTASTSTVTVTAGTSNGVAAPIGVQSTNTGGVVFSEYVLATAAGAQTMTWTCSPAAGMNCWEGTFAYAPFFDSRIISQAVNRSTTY